jgi:toxin ParE1/3/4
MPASRSGYRLRPQAEADLEQIWLYTAERWSPDQAERYLRMIVTVFGELASGEKRGRTVDLRDGYLKHSVGSHVVYYTALEETIEVIRVLHGRMDVDSHL